MSALPTPGSKEVRPSPFSSAAVNAALDRQLARVEPGHAVAFVATAERVEGKLRHRMAVMVNLDLRGTWSFGGFIEGDVKHPLSKVGAELRFSL